MKPPFGISSATVLMIALVIATGPPAFSQTFVSAPRKAGEVVMTSSGTLAAPWKEMRACVGKTENCKVAVFNPKTREIARLGDKWATKFAATGNGKEVRRAETAIEKAIRLTPGYVAPKTTEK